MRLFRPPPHTHTHTHTPNIQAPPNNMFLGVETEAPIVRDLAPFFSIEGLPGISRNCSVEFSRRKRSPLDITLGRPAQPYPKVFALLTPSKFIRQSPKQVEDEFDHPLFYTGRNISDLNRSVCVRDSHPRLELLHRRHRSAPTCLSDRPAPYSALEEQEISSIATPLSKQLSASKWKHPYPSLALVFLAFSTSFAYSISLIAVCRRIRFRQYIFDNLPNDVLSSTDPNNCHPIARIDVSIAGTEVKPPLRCMQIPVDYCLLTSPFG